MSAASLERQHQLLRLIEERRRVTIPQVCEALQVSEATARRDLNALAEEGTIVRIHGGARALHQAPPEPPVMQRAQEQAEEKQRIAAAAAAQVADGDTLFLGSGTTTMEVARLLRNHRSLTVFSNSLLVAAALGGAAGVEVTLLGGTVRASEQSLIGPLTMRGLADLRAVKVIMGIRALHPVEGLTNAYLDESLVDRALLQAASQVILVADHTKCGRVSTVFVAPLAMVDLLVTDTGAPEPFVAALRQQGLRVLMV
jgi:DeoR/GlpR family transcriptional regulator of sugar metabolism